ncbi:hypothetical protein ACFL3A_14990, partial [Pseudomonadota bacterium]
NRHKTECLQAEEESIYGLSVSRINDMRRGTISRMWAASSGSEPVFLIDFMAHYPGYLCMHYTFY